jgi:tetratricopeptide (TPR) repeat protein
MTRHSSAVASLIAARQYEAAIAKCERLLADDPSDSETAMTAGMCHAFMGNWAGATRCFVAAGSLDGDDPTALVMLAGCYQSLGDEESHERCVKKATELSNAPEQVFGGLALVQQQGGDWSRAASNYEIALKYFADGILRQMSEHNGADAEVKCWPGKRGTAWLKYADHAWTQAVSDDALAGFVLPTQVMFADESLAQRDRGLYWRDVRHQDGTLLRQYLPNGVHTFLYRCYDSKDYRTMVTGRAVCLGEAGRAEEAEAYVREASLFKRLELSTDSVLSGTDPGLTGFAFALLGGIREHASSIHISVDYDNWTVFYEIEGRLRSLLDVCPFLPVGKEAGLLAIKTLKEHANMTAGPNGDEEGTLEVTCSGHPVSFDVVVTHTVAGALARLTTRSQTQPAVDTDAAGRGMRID